MKIGIVKAIDRSIGTVLAAVLPSASTRAVADPRRILVIRPGGIGDAVLLAPALLALKRRLPQAAITVLAEARNAAAFSLCPAVDDVLLYHEPGDLLKAIRGGYDVVIDSEQSHRLSAVVSRLALPSMSIGFATNNRRRLFGHRIGYSHDDYEAFSFFNLLAPLGIEPPEQISVPFLSVPEEAAARAAALLSPLGGRPVAAIFPGASIAERRWGWHRFRELAGHLALRGAAIVVVGGKGEEDEGAAIVRGCGGVNLAGQTTLAETAAVIARSLVLISGDSGVLHLAVGLGVPTVSLFGPGIEAKWAPKGERDIVLNKKLPCSPCTRFGTTPPCPDKARCMTSIEVHEVINAVMDVVSAGSQD